MGGLLSHNVKFFQSLRVLIQLYINTENVLCFFIIIQGSMVGSNDGSDGASVLSHQDSDHGFGVRHSSKTFIKT